MKKYLILLLLFPFVGFSQHILSGFVTDLDNKPISEAYVFIQGDTVMYYTTGEDGSYRLEHFIDDPSRFKLVIYSKGYKEKTIPGKKVKEMMVVTLEKLEPKNIAKKEILENDTIALDETLVYSSFGIDSTKRINSILDKIISKYPSNYSQLSNVYKSEGFHSITEIKSEEIEDTLMYVKSPFYLEFPKVSDKNTALDSYIFLEPNSTMYVKNEEYIMPERTPFFLYEQLNWLDFIDKDFLTKRKNYEYTIISEDNDFYEIAFKVTKIIENSWSGKMKIHKADFAITYLEVNLEFNRKNSHTITLKNQTKNATSIAYFERGDIIFEYKKLDSGPYYLANLNSFFRLTHVGANPLFTPQFFIRSQFTLKRGIVPIDNKPFPINDLLYLTFNKNNLNLY